MTEQHDVKEERTMESLEQIAARNAGEPEVTVYKDGSWRVQGSKDAYYEEACEPDFLVSIPVAQVLRPESRP